MRRLRESGWSISVGIHCTAGPIVVDTIKRGRVNKGWTSIPELEFSVKAREGGAQGDIDVRGTIQCKRVHSNTTSLRI